MPDSFNTADDIRNALKAGDQQALWNDGFAFEHAANELQKDRDSFANTIKAIAENWKGTGAEAFDKTAKRIVTHIDDTMRVLNREGASFRNLMMYAGDMLVWAKNELASAESGSIKVTKEIQWHGLNGKAPWGEEVEKKTFDEQAFLNHMRPVMAKLGTEYGTVHGRMRALPTTTASIGPAPPAPPAPVTPPTPPDPTKPDPTKPDGNPPGGGEPPPPPGGGGGGGSEAPEPGGGPSGGGGSSGGGSDAGGGATLPPPKPPAEWTPNPLPTPSPSPTPPREWTPNPLPSPSPPPKPPTDTWSPPTTPTGLTPYSPMPIATYEPPKFDSYLGGGSGGGGLSGLGGGGGGIGGLPGGGAGVSATAPKGPGGGLPPGLVQPGSAHQLGGKGGPGGPAAMGPMGAGGMPMMPGGGAGGAGGQNQDRERTTWLQEDEEIWGADGAGAPPVLGRGGYDYED